MSKEPIITVLSDNVDLNRINHDSRHRRAPPLAPLSRQEMPTTRPKFWERRDSNNRHIMKMRRSGRPRSPSAPRPRPRPRSPSPAPPPPPPPRNTNQTMRPGTSYWDIHRTFEEGRTEFYEGSADMRGLLATRQVDGLVDPNRDGAFTVHLELKVYEDLDQRLEELSYLSRIGHFDAARKFFTRNLQDQIHKPYVRVQYGELLLLQGDFKTLKQLEGPNITNHDAPNDVQLLHGYWDMMQLYAARHKPSAIEADKTSELLLLLERTQNFNNISSTQIKIIALALQMVTTPSKVEGGSTSIHIVLDRILTSTFIKNLYDVLLRQGRVWDLYDFLISLVPYKGIAGVFCDLFGMFDIHSGCRNIIMDWTEHSRKMDISTTLALLGLFTSMIATQYQVICEPYAEVLLDQTLPLATALREQDPKTIKSRPFLRWILEKSRLEGEKDGDRLRTLFWRLQSFVGVAYRTSRIGLPQYAPLQDENPGWDVADAGTGLKEPVRLVLRTARELHDYEMEVLALQQLILFSKDPSKEFEELCYLHKSVREDFQGYMVTLVSTYLISVTKEAKSDLAKELSTQLLATDCSEYLLPDVLYMANMVLSALSGDGAIAENAAERAVKTVAEIDVGYLDLEREIRTKTPNSVGLRQPRCRRERWRYPQNPEVSHYRLPSDMSPDCEGYPWRNQSSRRSADETDDDESDSASSKWRPRRTAPLNRPNAPDFTRATSSDEEHPKQPPKFQVAQEEIDQATETGRRGTEKTAQDPSSRPDGRLITWPRTSRPRDKTPERSAAPQVISTEREGREAELVDSQRKGQENLETKSAPTEDGYPMEEGRDFASS
ncbi:hypothetical protein HD806DRAFT_512937 [Xylariaceae sp. AK1471]|nr:hypothetical protein HD806DRAFT_512937 [Xylariaceae sp. AK1471]